MLNSMSSESSIQLLVRSQLWLSLVKSLDNQPEVRLKSGVTKSEYLLVVHFLMEVGLDGSSVFFLYISVFVHQKVLEHRDDNWTLGNWHSTGLDLLCAKVVPPL